MKNKKSPKHDYANQNSHQTNEEQAKRIEIIRRKRWVNYPKVLQVLKRLDMFFDRPRGDRMPSMLVHGESGMGKTMLAKKFLLKHPESYDKDKGVATIPIIYVEIPPAVTDERDFYIEILTAIGAPFPWSARPAELRILIKQVLKEVRCKMLLIDESNNLLSGTPRQLRIMLNTLRYLSNQCKISLICFGLNSTLNIIIGDPQLSNRMESFNLEPLTKMPVLKKFVNEIVKHQQLYRETDFNESELIREILQRTGGKIGMVIPLLQEAAIYAVEKGIEKITIDVLRNIDKQPPLVSMLAKNRSPA